MKFNLLSKKAFCLLTAGFLVFCIIFYDILRVKSAESAIPVLPAPTEMIKLSKDFSPVILQGIKINPDNPLEIDFIIDDGSQCLNKETSQNEIINLINYFLAALTIPENDLWVNFSPYEKERIIPKQLSETSMGSDMLLSDYLLKQLSSSLTHPDTKLGKKYWKQNVDTQRAVKEFNKLWIVPEFADLYVDKTRALIGRATLKVESQADYLALANVGEKQSQKSTLETNILIQALNKEINRGEHFARLRQIYHSLILAQWFKEVIQDSLYNQYFNMKKTTGIEIDDKTIKNRLFRMYCDSFNNGVYKVTRKLKRSHKKQNYFSGGLVLGVGHKLKKHPIDEISTISADKIQKVALVPIANNYTSISSSIGQSKENIIPKIDGLQLEKKPIKISLYGRFLRLINSFAVVSIGFSSSDPFFLLLSVFISGVALYSNLAAIKYLPVGIYKLCSKLRPKALSEYNARLDKAMKQVYEDMDNRRFLKRGLMLTDGLLLTRHDYILDAGGKAYGYKNGKVQRFIMLPFDLSLDAIRYYIIRRAIGFEYLRIHENFKRYFDDIYHDDIDKVFEEGWSEFSIRMHTKHKKFYKSASFYLVLWNSIKTLIKKLDPVTKKENNEEILSLWKEIFVLEKTHKLVEMNYGKFSNTTPKLKILGELGKTLENQFGELESILESEIDSNADIKDIGNKGRERKARNTISFKKTLIRISSIISLLFLLLITASKKPETSNGAKDFLGKDELGVYQIPPKERVNANDLNKSVGGIDLRKENISLNSIGTIRDVSFNGVNIIDDSKELIGFTFRLGDSYKIKEYSF